MNMELTLKNKPALGALNPESRREQFTRKLQTKTKSRKRDFILWLLAKISLGRQEMAAYAQENTSFYKRLYAGISGKYRSLKEVPFAALPLVLKKDVNESSPFDLLSRRLEDKVFKYAETTGSTGSPTPSFFTRKEFAGSVLLSRLTPYSAILDRQLLRENRRAVCGLACGFTIAGASFQQIFDELGFLTVNVDTRTTIAPPHRVARLLARYKPAVIAAAETDFLAWMRVLKEDYPTAYPEVIGNLKVLLSTAELCSIARSRQLGAHFDIIHIDNYACVEGYFSVPCPCGEKHILPIYETEVLTANLKASSNYGTGRFAFTNLYRKSTPFVRYLLDDLVTIFRSDCPYGFTKSIIPHGRYELSVEIGGRRFATEHFESQLFLDHLFGEYQVSIHHDHIFIAAENYSACQPDVQNICHRFKTFFGLDTSMEVLPYGQLKNYRDIRLSKPLLRLVDKRQSSTQEIPRYL